MPTSKKIVLPQMGCGTWAWGNRLLWGYDESMDAQLQEVFNLCVSNGVTLFDTGDSYGTGKLNGQSEKLLGKFDGEYTGANKDNICLATKLAAYPWRLSRKSMVKAAQASIERMGRVDLAQMHWSTANYFPWQEEQLLDGLGDLYERGLVKGIGLSNYGTKRLKKIHAKFSRRSIPIATLQVQYSLLSTYPVTELGIKETCDELGIKLIAYSPLCLGILTGKYTDSQTYPKGLRGLLFKRLVPEAQSLLNCIEAIALYRQKTMAQVGINWCIAKGAIPIPGAKNIQQAQENIAAKDWQLDAGEIAELDRAAAGIDKPMVQNIFQTR
ncbi:aldo/keto reductase [Waterburya agarophytonicola K14]|uniref:Aldo/keto reductase n=1 Tax=Waterburya agarophytonicola KI4 TaxID=2874699 RepID=A0A964BTI5_9CYAN|nr:aldo/keto reductase [Waterburya agarophytonicola]MCC0178253.1 aldo/keto reductase [Waterburya agarophytonicola KI4]